MSLRKHQAEFEKVKNDIKVGAPIDEVILKATPGAGKSTIPVQACDILNTRLADRILWVVPRLSLANQAESNFVDPFFKEMFNHNFNIRASTNDYNPCRGTNGFVTTYQAIGMDTKKTILQEMDLRKYIVVLDEFHHVEDDGVWHTALKPIIDRAAVKIFMTGTLGRGDNSRIAYTPYEHLGRNRYIPNFSLNEDYRYIVYTRTDALEEQAILRTKFYLYDGIIEYQNATGLIHKGKLSDQYENASDAICTALNTKFADNLISEGFNHWTEYKCSHPRSKIMVVCTDIAHAKDVNKKLNKLGFVSKVAVSDDPKSQAILKEFKHSRLDVLVSVAMAYEGFDCKPLTHVIFLTNIRSVPWIEQVIARPVRIDPEAGYYDEQMAYIFAPDDPLFRGVVEVIIAEQDQIAKRTPEPQNHDEIGQLELFEAGPGVKPLRIKPINGEINGSREINIGNIPVYEKAPKTISEQEQEFRSKIDTHVKRFCSLFNKRYESVNSEIKDAFKHKARNLMEISELKACYRYVLDKYPLSGITGNGRKRSKRYPTKAIPWSPTVQG